MQKEILNQAPFPSTFQFLKETHQAWQEEAEDILNNQGSDSTQTRILTREGYRIFFNTIYFIEDVVKLKKPTFINLIKPGSETKKFLQYVYNHEPHIQLGIFNFYSSPDENNIKAILHKEQGVLRGKVDPQEVESVEQKILEIGREYKNARQEGFFGQRFSANITLQPIKENLPVQIYIKDSHYQRYELDEKTGSEPTRRLKIVPFGDPGHEPGGQLGLHLPNFYYIARGEVYNTQQLRKHYSLSELRLLQVINELGLDYFTHFYIQKMLKK